MMKACAVDAVGKGGLADQLAKVVWFVFCGIVLQRCKHFDWMNSQALHNIAELRQSLKKRKYKAVLSRVQRLIDQLSNDCFSQEYLFQLYMAQSAAINKLFERNLLKKYKYQPALVEELITLLAHNLERCEDILVELLQINPEAKSKPQKDTSPPYFSLLPLEEDQNNIKLQKIESTHQHRPNPLTHKYLEKYVRLLNASIVNVVQMSTIYKRTLEWETIQNWVELLQELKFMTAPYLLSLSKIMLFYCKYLSAGTQEQLVQSQPLLDKVVQNLVDSMRLSNRANYLVAGHEQKVMKYSKIKKQAFKLVVIGLVLSIRNNMKLQKEELATFGAKVVNTIVQNISSHGFIMFRRYLLPELYVHEQYLKYRAEKLDLLTVTELYFAELLPRVQATNLEITQKRNKWANQALKKDQVRREARESNKAKPVVEELSTAKSISNERGKFNNNSTSIIYRNSKESSECSKIYRETLFSNLIAAPIDEIILNYSQIKKNISLQTCRRPTPPTTNPAHPKTLRKQRMTAKLAADENQQDLDLKQRCSKICRQDRLARQQLRTAQQHLTRKVKYNLPHPDQAFNIHPVMLLNQQIQNSSPCFNPRPSEDHECEQEDTELKMRSRNSHLLNKPTKVKVFVEILFLNKNWLGIRKIAEKFQLLKKKEEEKQKMISNRPTSTVNQSAKEVGQRPDSINHLQMITQAILNKHSGRGDSGESAEARKQQENRKQIEANYILGQDSIEAIRFKLEKKLCRNEKAPDKSQLNEEAFKQKLKQLGTRNFFFKRVDPSTAKQTNRSDSKEEQRSETFKAPMEGSAGSIQSAFDLKKKCSIVKGVLRRSNFIQDEFI